MATYAAGLTLNLKSTNERDDALVNCLLSFGAALEQSK
jgi:hypothetical protein